MAHKVDGGGLRYNDGKLRFDLIPPDVLRELAKVLTRGARKYAERNWERGMKWSNCRASKERHWNDWLRGRRVDPESVKGMRTRTLAHEIVNTMFLLAYELRGLRKLDDIEPFMRAKARAKK